MDRLKEMKDILDEYPYCDNRDIDRDLLQWAVKEIERLRREKEWLLYKYTRELSFVNDDNAVNYEKKILEEMQRVLKDK